MAPRLKTIRVSGGEGESARDAASIAIVISVAKANVRHSLSQTAAEREARKPTITNASGMWHSFDSSRAHSTFGAPDRTHQSLDTTCWASVFSMACFCSRGKWAYTATLNATLPFLTIRP